MRQRVKSTQEWLKIETIFDQGIVKLKDGSYIKIIKIIPINYQLKSELEKESILNSYQLFLKTCNFDFQILIQSNKENLSEHISRIKEKTKKEENLIQKLANQYIEFIQSKNQNNKSSSKNFFILIKNSDFNQSKIEKEKLIKEELNEKYFKIKENLSRCGNIVQEYTTKQETIEVLFSFLNQRSYQNKTR